jgi:hypothetical protein
MIPKAAISQSLIRKAGASDVCRSANPSRSTSNSEKGYRRDCYSRGIAACFRQSRERGGLGVGLVGAAPIRRAAFFAVGCAVAAPRLL